MAREALGQERFPGAEKIVLITHRRRHVKITHTFEIFLFVCLCLSQILRVHPRALAPGLRSGVRDLKLAVLRYVLTCQVCPATHWNPAAEYVVVNRKAMVVSSNASQSGLGRQSASVLTKTSTPPAKSTTTSLRLLFWEQRPRTGIKGASIPTNTFPTCLFQS